MREEFDSYLCRTYPKIFKNRHAPMTQTAMCWGFDIGDGWFKIIDCLCSLIQSHIDWTREQRASEIKYNRALKRALNGDVNGLVHFYSYKGEVTQFTLKSVERELEAKKYREVMEKVPQVVADQVKEKFGTLRFYYHGGDDTIDGMVRMAECMSAVTCEACGSPGRSTNGGWITVLCEKHAEERNATLTPAKDYSK